MRATDFVHGEGDSDGEANKRQDSEPQRKRRQPHRGSHDGRHEQGASAASGTIQTPGRADQTPVVLTHSKSQSRRTPPIDNDGGGTLLAVPRRGETCHGYLVCVQAARSIPAPMIQTNLAHS